MLLAERPEFREARPQTVFMHLNFIRHWRHPLRDGLGELRDAVEEALDQGDQEYAGFLVAVLLSQSVWVGRPLAEIDALASSLIPHIRSQPVPSALCQGTHQYCLNLMGRSADPLLVAGESGYDERDVLPAARREGDEVALGAAAARKQGLHFWCGDYAAAAAATPEAIEHLGGMVGTAISQLIYLIGALSMIQHAPRDRSTARFVHQALALHRKWAAGAPENYAAPHALIQGSWARARGQHAKAERYLHQAIELAEESQLPMISAYAHEEAAALYADMGRATLREHMLRSAYQRWLNLGFAVRTDWLAREHPWLLRRDLTTGSAGIDPVGAHQLLRALSGAPNQDGVANIILGSVADTTGAGRVLLLTGEAENLSVRAIQDHGHISIVDGPWTEVAYDRDIVRRVMDGGSPVIVAADHQGAVHTRRSDQGARQDNWRDLRRAGRVRQKLRRRPRAGGRLPVRPGCRAPVELPARGTTTGGRRAPTVPDGRAVEIRAQRTAAHPRHRRPSPRPQRLPGRTRDDGAHQRHPWLHDHARGHERRRGKQLGDGLSAGCRAPDHQLQRHDPRRTRGRDRRRLRIGARRRPGGIGDAAFLARAQPGAQSARL